MKHTSSDLAQMQSLPLEAKIRMTERRIEEWVEHFGIDGVYVSFSGGKDSTVLLDIARKLYPDIKAMFVDTGLEYPEIRDFVRTYDNVDWCKPKMNFRKVIEKYGYPFISKEVTEAVYGARRYLKSVMNSTEDGGGSKRKPYWYFYDKVTGQGAYAKRKPDGKTVSGTGNKKLQSSAMFRNLNKDGSSDYG